MHGWVCCLLQGFGRGMTSSAGAMCPTVPGIGNDPTAPLQRWGSETTLLHMSGWEASSKQVGLTKVVHFPSQALGHTLSSALQAFHIFAHQKMLACNTARDRLCQDVLLTRMLQTSNKASGRSLGICPLTSHQPQDLHQPA